MQYTTDLKAAIDLFLELYRNQELTGGTADDSIDNDVNDLLNDKNSTEMLNAFLDKEEDRIKELLKDILNHNYRLKPFSFVYIYDGTNTVSIIGKDKNLSVFTVGILNYMIQDVSISYNGEFNVSFSTCGCVVNDNPDDLSMVMKAETEVEINADFNIEVEGAYGTYKGIAGFTFFNFKIPHLNVFGDLEIYPQRLHIPLNMSMKLSTSVIGDHIYVGTVHTHLESAVDYSGKLFRGSTLILSYGFFDPHFAPPQGFQAHGIDYKGNYNLEAFIKADYVPDASYLDVINALSEESNFQKINFNGFMKKGLLLHARGMYNIDLQFRFKNCYLFKVPEIKCSPFLGCFVTGYKTVGKCIYNEW